MEPSATRSPDRERLILGFDAGCATCSDLARRIEEAVGAKLEVRPLHDPQVAHWREQTLGEDAPWAPTLIEVNRGAVRAWTGKRMGLKLGRALGPVATWRVMQVLGEVGAAPEVAEASPVARIGSRMNRGQFLKGIGGAAVAMGLLSATGGLASPAQAAGPTKAITGDRLARVARRVAGREDVVNVAGPAFRDKVRSGEITEIKAGRQTVGGTGSLVVVYVVGNNKVLSYREYDEPYQDVETEAMLLRVEGEEITAELESVNGDLPEPLSQDGRIRCSGCVPGRPTGGKRPGTKCSRWTFRCLRNVAVISCALCIPTCTPASPALCAACIIFSCGPLVGKCCTRRYRACVTCA